MIRLLALAFAASFAACSGVPAREPRGAAALLERARTEHLWNSDRKALRYADRAAEAPDATAAERALADRLGGEYRLAVGDPEGARERLARALALSPADPDAPLLLARAWRDEPERALEWAARAVKAAEGAAPARKGAALRLSAEIRADLADDAGAEGDLKAALALDAGDLEALRGLARAAKRRGGDAAAWAAAAERAADAVPEWQRPAARRYAALVRLDLGDDDGAARQYARALELDPDDLESLEGLVAILERRPKSGLRVPPPGVPPRRPEDSWSEWTPEALARAERLDPDGVEALRLRAAKAKGERRGRDASREAARLAEALWRAPLWQQAAGEIMAARMQLDLGEAEEASVRLATAFRLEPHSIPAWRLQSALGAARQSSRLAVSVIHSTVGADQLPDAARALAETDREIAAARWTLGDAAGSRLALERSLRAVPDDPAALSLRARMDAPPPKKGPPPDDALAVLEKAIRAGKLPDAEAAAAELKAWRAGAGAPEERRSLRAAVVERLGASAADVATARLLMEQSPDEPRGKALLARALTLEARRRLDAGGAAAAGELREALALDPSSLAALELLVRADPAGALAEVDARRPAAPSPRWTALRGLARLRASGWDAARADLEAAFASDAALVCRAEPAQAGRDAFPAAYFDLCLRRFPRDASLYADRGVARFKAGSREGAIADFRRAVELDPKNEAARLSLEAALK